MGTSAHIGGVASGGIFGLCHLICYYLSEWFFVGHSDLVILIVWTVGLYLFFWLIADVLPQREQRF